MEYYKCPDCGADLLDWRTFPEDGKFEIDRVKPFECTALRCGKRWNLDEILQKKWEQRNAERSN